MEIKRIAGVISAYNTNRTNKVKKTESSVSAKNIDRVEFGFDGIAAQVKADAQEQELAAAKQTAESGIPANELASYILFG